MTTPTVIGQADLIPTDSPFQFSTTGLIVSGQPTYDDWEAIWYYLKSRDVAMPWIIGDLLNFGEAAYGESIWQVTSEDDQRLVGHFKPGTLRNYKYVANRWPRERRIYDMAWSAYQAAASRSPEEQDYIMSQAESNGQGRNAVRDKVNGTFPGDRLHEMEVEAEKKDRRIAELESTQPHPVNPANPTAPNNPTIITRLSTILDLEPMAAARNIVQILGEIRAIVEELRQL